MQSLAYHCEGNSARVPGCCCCPGKARARRVGVKCRWLLLPVLANGRGTLALGSVACAFKPERLKRAPLQRAAALPRALLPEGSLKVRNNLWPFWPFWCPCKYHATRASPQARQHLGKRYCVALDQAVCSMKLARARYTRRTVRTTSQAHQRHDALPRAPAPGDAELLREVKLFKRLNEEWHGGARARRRRAGSGHPGRSTIPGHRDAAERRGDAGRPRGARRPRLLLSCCPAAARR